MFLFVEFVGSQDGATITLENAVVSEIADDGALIINGLRVFLVEPTDTPIEVGTALDLTGILQPGGTVLATAVIMADLAPAPVTIIGTVEAINVNIITIYNINITLPADADILVTLQIGDVVRVQGDVDTSDGGIVVVATTVTPAQMDDGPPIAIVGPVEQVSAFVVSVRGLNVVLAPDAPLLATLAVGDVVTVAGIVSADLQGTIGGITVVAIDIVLVEAGDARDESDDDDDDGGDSPTPTPETATPETATPETATPETATPETATPETPTPVVEDGDGLIIVIEGPVEQINVNIVTIFGINIALERNDPSLVVLQLGDVIRVEGISADDDIDLVSDEVDLIAVNIIFISVEVVIVEGIIWRDSGDCGNPPPDIVISAEGGVEWLIRCTGGNPGGGSSASGGGGGGGGNDGGGGRRGGGGGDDDDD